MSLAKHRTSSIRINAERWAKLRMGLFREPMTIVDVVSFGADGKEATDMHLLSPQMLRMLEAYANEMLKLVDSDKYAELRKENVKLRSQVGSLLRELKAVKGGDYKVSDECWKSIRESVYESIENTHNRLFERTE